VSAANPIDLARETIKQLAVRRLPPTPDNYLAVYRELAGEKTPDARERVVRLLLRVLGQRGVLKPGPLKKAEKAAAEHDWKEIEAEIAELAQAADAPPPAWAELLREFVRQWERKQTGLNTARKQAALERVLINFGADPHELYTKLQALVAAWAENRVAPVGVSLLDEDAAEKDAPAPPAATEEMDSLREMVAQCLVMGVVPRISQFPDLVDEANHLAEDARAARDEITLRALSKNLKQFWIRLAIRNETNAEVLDGLLRLLRLLVDNVAELVGDEAWLRGQVDVVRDILAQPLSTRVIYDAEQGFKEVLYKQGVLKQNISEAKTTFKTMVATFIGRLGEMTASTDSYHQKIATYAEEISKTDDIGQLNRVLGNLMADTRGMQLDIQRSRDEIVAARHKAEAAEAKIVELEAELEEMSAQVRQDHLTGALNRRGMDDAFGQEMARAERSHAPLAVAVMDIDHFKRFNDTYGHEAGDNALVHMVNVVKDVLRPTDCIARFGGEEFVILLPGTTQEDGVDVMVRVQRELTKRFFLFDNQRLLITFSCGVAAWRPGESAEEVIARADKALYQAKEAGRNRVYPALD
jgi:diguanylate cyclase